MEKFRMPDNDEVRKTLKYQLKRYYLAHKKCPCKQPSKSAVLLFKSTPTTPSSKKKEKFCDVVKKRAKKELIIYLKILKD